MKPCETAPGVVLTTAEEIQLLCPERKNEYAPLMLTLTEAETALSGLQQSLIGESLEDKRQVTACELSRCIGVSIAPFHPDTGKPDPEQVASIFGADYVARLAALQEERHKRESVVATTRERLFRSTIPQAQMGG